MSGSFKFMRWNAGLQTRPRFILSSERVLGNGVRTHVKSREKSPLRGAQRSVKPATLHHAGQLAQHTTNWALPAPYILKCSDIWPGKEVIDSRISDRLVGLVVKASAPRAEDPGFEFRLHRDFSGVESYQWLKKWHSSGYSARRLAL